MTIDKVNILLNNAIFKFAKSMPNIHHEYSLRETWANDEDFCNVVLWIRENGKKEKWFKKTFVYYYYNGFKYWTMGCPLNNCSKTGTILINKAKT